jgi:hypothetical protein
MTYGWAILAAVIAIGVLAYFGVFSPGKYVTGNAVVNPPFYVNAQNVKVAGITIELKDNGGEDYTINSVTITSCGTYTTATPIASGALASVLVTCNPALTVGDSFKGDITISYTKSGSSVALTSTGTISNKVTA